MTFRAINIVDCEVVPVLTLEEELASKQSDEWAQVRAILEVERERDLNERLTKSVELFKDGKIPADAPVIWEGEETTWGTLSQTEKMCVELNKDGILEGGYSF